MDGGRRIQEEGHLAIASILAPVLIALHNLLDKVKVIHRIKLKQIQNRKIVAKS